MKGLVTRNTHVQYESPISSGLKVMVKVNVSKVGQTSRSRLPGQTFFNHVKFRVLWSTHMKYESSIVFKL